MTKLYNVTDEHGDTLADDLRSEYAAGVAMVIADKLQAKVTLWDKASGEGIEIDPLLPVMQLRRSKKLAPIDFGPPPPAPEPPADTKMTVNEWQSLTPGMRREITRQSERAAANALHDAPM